MVRSVLAYAENRLDGLIREAPRPDEALGVYTSVIAPSVISVDSLGTGARGSGPDRMMSALTPIHRWQRPGSSTYMSRTALLAKRRAVRGTNNLVTKRA
jgi:hypothetical protein